MRKLKHKQNGAVMAEFAILLPLFLILSVGVTELATAFFTLNTLNKAVREGARLKAYAMDPNLPPGVTISDSTIVTEVQSIMAGLPYFYSTSGGTSVTPSIVTIGGLKHGRVDASYTHTFLLGQMLNRLFALVGGGGNLNASIQLNAHATMRIQQPS